MIPQNAITTQTPDYTSAELGALLRLRARYQADQDRWSAEERARLEFVRWLYETGRIHP